MATPIPQTAVSRNAATLISRAFESRKDAPASTASSLGVTALSVEFVAKPQEAHRVQSVIPAALSGALEQVSGFAGCMVMISEQEARLVTVLTLWVGEDRVKRCGTNARWVQKLLAPYLDRCLRVQTLAAHSPALVAGGIGMNFEDRYSSEHYLGIEDETVCVA